MTFSSPFSSSSAKPSTGGLTSQNFEYLREMLKREAAIYLEDGKEYLVETRLATLALKEGFADANALLEHCRHRGPSTGTVQEEMIDALTTNETLFFRDLHPFEALRTEVLPELKERCGPRRQISVWCGACSTGQEPYSLAMLLDEYFPEFATWRIEILATDLSQKVLERARTGIYQQFEVNRGLPAKLLVRYFSQNAGMWCLNESIRRRVRFERLNLIKPWPAMGPFEIVFLRNVLIYFEVEVRREILRRIKNLLAPGGYLILGNAETAVTLDRDFTPVAKGRATFFQLNR